MNVWDLGSRRPKGYKPKNTSKPPRTRAGHQFAGGRSLRRSMKALHARQMDYSKTLETLGRGGKRSLPATAYTRPGAM